MMQNNAILELILAEIEQLKELIQNQQPEFLSLQEFARRSGISVSGVRKMIADGRVKSVKIGHEQQSKVLIPYGELRRLGRLK